MSSNQKIRELDIAYWKARQERERRQKPIDNRITGAFRAAPFSGFGASSSAFEPSARFGPSTGFGTSSSAFGTSSRFGPSTSFGTSSSRGFGASSSTGFGPSSAFPLSEKDHLRWHYEGRNKLQAEIEREEREATARAAARAAEAAREREARENQQERRRQQARAQYQQYEQQYQQQQQQYQQQQSFPPPPPQQQQYQQQQSFPPPPPPPQAAPAGDPYTILGLPHGAPLADIKREYKILARKWHPDRNPGNVEESTRMMQAINRAYELLNPHGGKRKTNKRKTKKSRKSRKTNKSLRRK